MKKILVTGGAGFIGREVVRQLVQKGYKVRVADDLSKREAKVPEGCDFIKTDLTESKSAERALENIDLCVHLAAKIGGIGYFHKYPATILSENNKLYSTVFEAAVKNKTERILYLSSSMVFESTNSFPSSESDIAKIPPPVSAYGFSKLIGEEYCKAFYDEFGLNYTICRPFNAYGINEAPGREVGYAHVIPDLIKKILSGQYPLELLGDGQQTRCFTHVSDVADGIITVALSGKAKNEDFNIGSDKEIKMVELAKKVWKLMKIKKPFAVKFKKGFKFDIKRRVPDVAKTKKMLNWEPKVNFEEGLLEVIGWFKQN